MTEQEKREKAIEEISCCVANSACGKHHNCDTCRFNDYMFCEYRKIGEQLYDAGYRKEEEVRKEAIKEFVETVKRCLPNEPYLHTWLREIAFGKFGVEVEE